MTVLQERTMTLAQTMWWLSISTLVVVVLVVFAMWKATSAYNDSPKSDKTDH